LKLLLTTLAVLLISLKPSFSACSTNGTGGGTWSSASTWICAPESAPPGCASTIIIRSADSVYISSTVDLISCGPISIVIWGQLQFKTGKKLKLADGSSLELKTGATMYPGGGGGSSNYLEIGGNQVWTAADSTKIGPLIYTSGGVLPIKLINFEANTNDNKVDLKWETAVEINNDFFTVEKSVDGKLWETASIVSGAGNSNQTLEYFDSDYNPYKGVSYYRLKQTDYDGAFSYSNIVPVKFVKKYLNSGISVFPSPAQRGETVKVRFMDIYEEEILVVLRDVKGQEFYSKVILNIDDGVLMAIPIEKELPPGIYLVTASSENQMYSQKIVVK